MRLVIALLWLLGFGCGMAAAEDEPEPDATPAWAGHVPLPRPRPPLWAEPQSFREAAGPDFNSAEVTTEPSHCRKRLEIIANIEPMPRLIGPGACGGRDMVRLDAVQRAGYPRVEFRPAPVLRCEMAESLATWIQDEAVPRLDKAGMALRSVETYDDFDCRGRNRVVGAKMSEHGKGNALDMRSFTMLDGRVIGLTDVTAPKEVRAEIRESACARFTTVLGPGSDGHHESHIHADIAERSRGYRICQWDVREPPPVTVVAYVQIDGNPVPLPPPRPASADAPVKDGRKL